MLVLRPLERGVEHRVPIDPEPAVPHRRQHGRAGSPEHVLREPVRRSDRYDAIHAAGRPQLLRSHPLQGCPAVRSVRRGPGGAEQPRLAEQDGGRSRVRRRGGVGDRVQDGIRRRVGECVQALDRVRDRRLGPRQRLPRDRSHAGQPLARVLPPGVAEQDRRGQHVETEAAQAPDRGLPRDVVRQIAEDGAELLERVAERLEFVVPDPPLVDREIFGAGIDGGRFAEGERHGAASQNECVSMHGGAAGKGNGAPS